jgi:hypothetical protein
MRKALACLAALSLAGCVGEFDQTGQTQTDNVHLDKSGAEMVKLDLAMGAGELKMRGGAAKLIDGTFVYNIAAWKPDVHYDGAGFRGHIIIKQRSSAGNMGGNVKNEWNLQLADDVEWDMDVSLGAGESTLNLGSVKLRSAEVKIGAGRCELDLRGTPQRSSDIRIRGGVGEAMVWLPKDVGIIAEAEGGLGELKVDGLHKDGRSWVNDLYGKAKNTIRLDVRGGIGSIHIVAD